LVKDDIIGKLQQTAAKGLKSVYGLEVVPPSIAIQDTRPEFTGDFTIVTFPFAKSGKGSPAEIAQNLGEYLLQELPEISSFQVEKGFLNLSYSDAFWIEWINNDPPDENLNEPDIRKKVVIEFSSPNTNKPLHLGHLRNIFLGDSLCRILGMNGNHVTRVCLYNDRGIAICKTMVAYLRLGNSSTPESAGIKGDFFVAEYYVRFGREMGEEAAMILQGLGLDAIASRYAMLGKFALESGTSGKEEEAIKSRSSEFMKNSGIDKHAIEDQTKWMAEARELLLKWEEGDPATRTLWRQMNDWVYLGFANTYRDIGISFDKVYYESETYQHGADLAMSGLNSGVFSRKEDRSVWINLESEGLDQKAVLRSDGTSMYITQELGSAEIRNRDFEMDRSIYVVANEQDYHFRVLKLILLKLGYKWAGGIEHFSYGMVDLPSGKMKSREGTTVDADVLIADVIRQAKEETAEKGKTEGMTAEELDDLHRKLAIGALKFFILRVDPKKRMIYDPKESVSLEGDTGPFIQYAYARTASVKRKVAEMAGKDEEYFKLADQERSLIKQLFLFRSVLEDAGKELSPALLANYALDLAKHFNRFWHHLSILSAPESGAKEFRIKLTKRTGERLKSAMSLMGIEVPERM